MKKAEARSEVEFGQRMSIAVLGMLLLCSLSSSGCSSDAVADQTTPRADLVDIGERLGFEELERSTVLFPHDLHTEVMLERKEDCTLCHPVRPDGYLSAHFQQLEEIGDEELIDLYHDECIGCHEETMSAGKAAGPVACGECHRRQPVYVSSSQPFGFDKSLHYRHVKAADQKCEPCHHEYDEETERLVYIKGKESSCRDCHREETEENRSAFKLAAHEACIGCHREPPPEIIVEKNTAGPQLCVGCHDLQHQLAIEQIQNPPRLKRGQEDFVLVSASEADLASTKLRTVPFSHIDHEEAADTCRVCHHDTLDPCTKCHTLEGTDAGGWVTLDQAMHDKLANESCVGCHDAKKSTLACAGCHDQMEQGRLPEQDCDICHAGPLPDMLASERSRYRSIDDFRPSPADIALTFSVDEIPEKVEIGVLSHEYEPAVMPHRKIVDQLMKQIGENGLATYFHGSEDVVCQGCHHQSPIGEKPPLCENCHRPDSTGLELIETGLQGAYHRQCLGCHKSMEIKEPSDCTGCHKKRPGMVAAVASGVAR